MLAALGAAAIVCAASLVIGQALLALAGRRGWSPLAGGVGLAGLLVVCGLGGRVVVVLVVFLGAAAVLVASGHVGRGVRGVGGGEESAGRERGDSRRVGEFFSHTGKTSPIVWLGAALIAALGAAIPFLVNDRVGVLGVGLVNDDMANHLLMADWAQNGTEPAPGLIDDGYPLGPHSIAATLADLLGTGLVEAFAGLTLAIAALAAITALAVLHELPAGRRAIAAALAALPYLGAAYLVQGAFKEPLQALLLITFALLLVRAAPSDGLVPAEGTKSSLARFGPTLPIAVVVAAAIFNYSFPGLFWLAGAAALLLVLHVPRPTEALRTLRPLAAPLAATLALAALLTLPEWGRVVDFTAFGAFDPAGQQTGLGNLRQAISPFEALGVWPTGEFRLAPADASIPAAAFYLAGALGAVAVGIGTLRAVRRRREEAEGISLLAAFGAAAVIYLGAVIAGTPYTSAKALAIAAPPAMLLALRALLPRGAVSSLVGRARPPLALAGGVLAIVFVLAAGISTFLVLRQAPVSPAAHADELAQIRPLVEGEPVLFLGRDDFIAWHLRGAPVSTHIQNFFSTGRVPARVDPENGEKFDFDAVSAATLDRFDWVLTSSTAYASQPPESFELARRTPSYALWRRTGRTIPRELGGTPPRAEGTAPGGLLECSGLDFAEAPIVAGAWPVSPREGPASGWRPSATLVPGGTASQTLALGSGTWELSLSYDSPRPLELRVTGPGLDARRLELPANLDFRGPTPPFPAAPVLDLHHRGEYEVEVRLTEAPLAGRLLGGEGEAHLRGLFAVDLGAPVEREIGRPPCREYVDWYRSR